ncbi:hypothetical protein QFC20_001342 [Naganishia adeliensis]|uniref:Uncharacterized protein n=1 Tax=Naganishia adeliensis TaxID=92952 RepID=A0ACC2WTH0_9TREE|nr:hypothetical protein QFC20_001342 [Naganishia adeliensis]
MALITPLGLGSLCLAQPISSVTARSFGEGQYESFYIDVNDMPDYIKAVAIPSEKGKCNLFIQYLDISGHLFTDLGPQDKAGGGTDTAGYGVAYAFPACNQVSPPAPQTDDDAAKRLKVRDVDFRYGKNFLVLEDLVPSTEGGPYVQGTKISRYQVRDDKKGIPVYPRELVKAPEKEVLTGEYK